MTRDLPTSPPTISVRRWQASDRNAVWHVVETVWREFGIIQRAAAIDDLADIAATFGERFWVAEAGGVTIGTCALMPLDGRSFTLKRMYVLSAYRGGMAASRLLDAALTSARRAGATSIYLGTVEEAVASHRFYEKTGFVRVDADALPDGFYRSPEDTRFYRLALVGADRP